MNWVLRDIKVSKSVYDGRQSSVLAWKLSENRALENTGWLQC